MRTKHMLSLLLMLFTLLAALPCRAEPGRLVTIPTRPEVTVSFYYLKRPAAAATLMLLTGGAGGIGMKDGIPTSNNFLVRSRDLFAAGGYNVALVGKPSDRSELDGSFRIGDEHVADLKKVLEYLKKDTGLPVWVVGTSMGTISTAALAGVAAPGELAGIVLTSSVTAQKRIGAVPWQDLAKIRVPVLVLHHQNDECRICRPDEVGQILAGLKNAPVKRQVMVSGGANPRGNPCEALHWHGYIGMEQQVVDLITAWIAKPQP
ncbi:hypothetical protein GMLC_31800 [Geomonas limicola]|uniref:Alpha/beta hydrolase n=1 Tax=Geomonas limicola TaxID=2740186 RepID=A0A6V8NAS3_9BACT|nr:hypothetical protein [Geomonas limicola]GFO69601.1 hypothetical protein GMLC_31800 [Geomonas limicola]